MKKDTDLNLEKVTRQPSPISNDYIDLTNPYPTNEPKPLPDLYRAQLVESLESDETDMTLVVKLCLNVGYAYMQQSQEAPALDAYDRALNCPEIQRNPRLQAYILANIGEIYCHQNRIPAAAVKLKLAIEFFDQQPDPDPLEKRRALACLANIEQSITLYKEAINLYKQADDHSGLGKTYTGLAKLYLDQKCYLKAKHLYKKALVIANPEQDQDTLWYVYWGLGCCQYPRYRKAAIDSFNKSVKCIKSRQDALSIDEGKVDFLQNVQKVFEKLLMVHLELAQEGEQCYKPALKVAESARGQALQYLMQGRERRRYEPKQRTPPPPLVRLVYYSLSDCTAVFVATPDGEVKGHVVTVGDEAIAKQVMQLRRALAVDEVNRGIDLRKVMVVDQEEPEDSSPIKLETLLQKLYADFVAPVADALPADGSTIVIEAHCSLWLVPFAALQLADGTWMGDRWSLIYAPSHKTLQEIREEPSYASMSDSKLLAVGNPLIPTSFTLLDMGQVWLKPLHGAQEEVEAITKLFPEAQRTLLIQAEATKAAVTQLALSHNVVHLATHGMAFSSDPLMSLVFLATNGTEQNNGWLTAREIMQLPSLPADLVVLSACQTGLGKISGEGMLGLSRAFLVAGARSLVVSQWSVDDIATRELMIAFYMHYREHDNKGNKAIALQKAMQVVRSNPNFKDPRYWV